MNNQEEQTRQPMPYKKMLIWLIIALIVILGIYLAKQYFFPLEVVKIGAGSPDVLQLDFINTLEGYEN
jgi:hypothetical protein